MNVLGFENGNVEGVVKRRGSRWKGRGVERRISERMACYGVFTGAREFAYRASVTSPLAGFGHSRLGISSGADLRDNGDHSYGKPGGVSACDSVFASSSKATPLSTYRRI